MLLLAGLLPSGKAGANATFFQIWFSPNGEGLKPNHTTKINVWEMTSDGAVNSRSPIFYGKYIWTKSNSWPTSGTWSNFNYSSNPKTVNSPTTPGFWYLHVEVWDSYKESKKTSKAFITGNVAHTAHFPMQYMNITQGEYGSYSHQGILALDIAGKDWSIDDFMAPFRGKIVKIDASIGNAVWLESIDKVLFADGTYDYMTVLSIHDNNISNLYVGKIIEKDVVYYQEGTAGNATGNHVHMTVFRGKYSTRTSISAYKGLFIRSSTIIINDKGYNWIPDGIN
jgi:hypothetical protein